MAMLTSSKMGRAFHHNVMHVKQSFEVSVDAQGVNSLDAANEKKQAGCDRARRSRS